MAFIYRFFKLYLCTILVVSLANAETARPSGVDCKAVFNIEFVNQWVHSSFPPEKLDLDTSLRDTHSLLLQMNTLSSQPPINAKFLQAVSAHINLRFEEAQLDSSTKVEEFKKKLLEEVTSLKNFYHFLFRLEIIEKHKISDVEIAYIVENISPETIFTMNQLGSFSMDEGRMLTLEDNIFALSRFSTQRHPPFSSDQFQEALITMVKQIKDYPEDPQNVPDAANSFFLRALIKTELLTLKDINKDIHDYLSREFGSNLSFSTDIKYDFLLYLFKYQNENSLKVLKYLNESKSWVSNHFLPEPNKLDRQVQNLKLFQLLNHSQKIAEQNPNNKFYHIGFREDLDRLIERNTNITFQDFNNTTMGGIDFENKNMYISSDLINQFSAIPRGYLFDELIFNIIPHEISHLNSDFKYTPPGLNITQPASYFLEEYRAYQTGLARKYNKVPSAKKMEKIVFSLLTYGEGKKLIGSDFPYEETIGKAYSRNPEDFQEALNLIGIKSIGATETIVERDGSYVHSRDIEYLPGVDPNADSPLFGWEGHLLNKPFK